MEKYQEQMREHNKFMKRIGAPEQVMNLQEYIAYAQGNHKPKVEPRAVSLPRHETGNAFERTPDLPSASSEKVLLQQLRNLLCNTQVNVDL